MKLAKWMESQGLDDEALAAKIRQRGLRCTDSWIRQIRLGHGEAGKKIIAAIEELSEKKVRYTDLVRGAA